MPCSDAMITDVVTARPDQTVEEALHILQERDIRGFPVVNENNQVLGVFNFATLLLAVLPMSVSLDDDFMHHKHLKLSLDYTSGQAPWLADRLSKVLPKKLEEVMTGEARAVHPETPLGEGARRLLEYGSPLPVAEKGTNVLVGIITSQSTLSAIIGIKDNLEDYKDTKF
ncbi:MAG: hypothetical protein DHS20C02_05450 [Micavibrio sp.]|nr:MAG: hypothetical protein DHS20C02_05450 [Micavibrio sp.]